MLLDLLFCGRIPGFEERLTLGEGMVPGSEKLQCPPEKSGREAWVAAVSLESFAM